MIELVALMATMASAEHGVQASSMAFTMSSTGRTAWSGPSTFVDTRRRSTPRPSPLEPTPKLSSQKPQRGRAQLTDHRNG